MDHGNDEGERVGALEARVKALSYALAAFMFLALLNLGLGLWLAQQRTNPDYDFIALVLTVFEVFVAVAVIGGFWMLREAARGRAAEVAREEAREVAEPAARRAATAYMSYIRETNGQDDDILLQEMMQKLDQEEGDDG